jgi:capsular exopolysaccharide synthesis family protein
MQDASLKVQYADAATKYGASNPHIFELQNQVAQLDKQMLEEMKRISQRAKNDYDLAMENERQINKAFESESKKAVQVNGDALKAQMLAEEASSNQLLYEELYARLQQAGVSVGLQGTNIDLVDPALLPAAPKWPNRQLNLALGLLFGIAIGVGYSFILENVNDTISTAVEVESLTGIPVYGSIPRFDSIRSRRGAYEAISRAVVRQTEEPSSEADDQAWTIKAPKSIIAESYRGLRTSLLLSRPAGTLKTIMVTSPAPGDGKSTTSYNLAVALAQGERRVVLVDADLRRPRLHALMKVKSTPGLSNVLTAGLDVNSALVQHPLVENLQFLPAGNIPPTPAELLGSQRFTDLLTALQKEFDIVLLDCTPDTMVSDAVIVGNHADTILLVARADVTKHRMLQRAIEVLQRQCRNTYLALVINAVDMMSADYYYDYGYYGKGKYYDNETEDS